MSPLVDLAAALLRLVAPVAPGGEILAGVRLVGAFVDAGPRLGFESDGEGIVVEISPADSTSPAVASSGLLRFAYLGSGSGARSLGLAVCRAVAESARRNEADVLGELARAPDSTTPTSRVRRVRDVRVTRLLEPASDGLRRFYTLSPYVGCLIGCRFCYAQSHVALARRLCGLPAAPWGSYVDVRVNAPEVLASELETGKVEIVKMCPIVSDPYHAIEESRGITRGCLAVLGAARRPPATMVLTRSRLVERDAAQLGALGAYVGFSIPTYDDAARRHFEPRAASIPERFASLARLRAAGARTFAVVQPMLPGPVDALADALAASCESISIDVLHGVEGAAREFEDPRFEQAADAAWQTARAHDLAAALASRGVPLWRGELPPGLT